MAKRAIEILTVAECRRLLDACTRGYTGIRNRALIVLLWRAGLRCGEALALARRDIDFARQTVRVRRGKGGKARTVALDTAALAIVEKWRNVRPKAANRFLCTLSGKAMNPSYVRHLFSRLGERAEIEKRVHPHGLRHTCAVELSREGVPVHVISATLGHASVATTAHYLAHCEPREVVQALSSRQW